MHIFPIYIRYVFSCAAHLNRIDKKYDNTGCIIYICFPTSMNIIISQGIILLGKNATYNLYRRRYITVTYKYDYSHFAVVYVLSDFFSEICVEFILR